MSDTFNRQQVDDITAPWINLCKEQGQRIEQLEAENAKLLAAIAKLKKIRPTKPRRGAESYLEWFDDGWNTCVERIEAALREGKE